MLDRVGGQTRAKVLWREDTFEVVLLFFKTVLT